MAIFLDTGFYLGLVHPKDDNASRAGEILTELSQSIHDHFCPTKLNCSYS